MKNSAIIKAYKIARFNKTKTAQMLGVARSTLYEKIKHSKELQQDIADAEETRLDNAEEALNALVEDNHYNAVRFLLETKGSSRGYGKQEQEHAHTFVNSDDITDAIKRKYKEK